MIAPYAGLEHEADRQPDNLLSSRRLWSLWDMLNFDLPMLLNLAKEVGRIITLDHEDYEPIPEFSRESHVGAAQEFAVLFEKLGLTICKLQADRVIRQLQDNATTIGDLKILLAEMQNRIFDECSVRYFMVLSDREKELFLPQSPLFGTAVEDKLPSIIEDIAEAGKCLGLGRSTAAVFHLMRVMETGVQRFAEKLDVELPDSKVWQVLLDQINKQIKSLGKQARGHASVAAHLYNVKLAWRNEAMHPKATYTIEEAEGIFYAVKNFTIDLIKVL